MSSTSSIPPARGFSAPTRECSQATPWRKAVASPPASAASTPALSLSLPAVLNGGITRVGRFTANGATITNVLEDTDDGGRFIQTDSGTNASISLDAAHPGRGTFTFTDPNFASTPGKYTFYLNSATQGVIQETTLANNAVFDVADGSIVAQTGSPFSSSNIAGTYALNWSGLSLQSNGVFASQDEEDLVGQVTVSSLNFAGAADIFQFQ